MKDQSQAQCQTNNINNTNINTNTINHNTDNSYITNINNNNSYPPCPATQQRQQQQDIRFNNYQRLHQQQQQNRCQVITPQQTLLPTIAIQTTRHQPTINPTNYHLQQHQPQSLIQETTMSSTTAANFLQNQFSNFANQHFETYLNQQHNQQQQQQQQNPQQQLHNYQQQLPNYSQIVNRNYMNNFQQQQQVLQHQHQPQQQQLTQSQRRQQLHLSLSSKNNSTQQFQQNPERHHLFEQYQLQNAMTTTPSSNHNGNHNGHNAVGTSASAHAGHNPNGNEVEKFSMDANEIANFLATELFMQQLVSVDGIQSGVPTLTTSTLTPTTLRSIEETFIQLVDEHSEAPYRAGFIPPTYPSTSANTSNSVTGAFNGSVHEYNDSDSEDSQTSLGPRMYDDYQGGEETTENSSATTDSTSFQNGLSGLGNKSSLATSNSNSASANDFTAAIAAAVNGKKSSNKNNVNTSLTSATTTATTTVTTSRRNQGGRRPTKPVNLTPEEEEKRRVRRERNKLAAARCRKRRVDLTNDLLEEVAQLERKRDGLQKDIESLNTQKQELEYILEAHRPTCQKIRQDLLSVNTFGGLIAPTNIATNSNDSNHSGTITGIDTTLASTGRGSPIDLKPEILHDNLLSVPHIKHEPLDSALDSESLDNDGPSSPKRMLLTNNNPMIPPLLPKIATLSSSLAAAASASLNTPIVATAPVSFGSFGSSQNNTIIVNTLNALNKPLLNVVAAAGGKQRPTTLPTMPRNPTLGLNVANKPPTDINGVAIQTPSTGMFNFDSLMDGGTGLTPVSGPLVPTCSSQNKHPLELTTPTSEPSKLVSL